MYNYQCKYCGAYLDPGEKCECLSELRKKKATELKAMQAELLSNEKREEPETLRNSKRLQEMLREAESILKPKPKLNITLRELIQSQIQ